jgi:hypothetical protein
MMGILTSSIIIAGGGFHHTAVGSVNNCLKKRALIGHRLFALFYLHQFCEVGDSTYTVRFHYYR